jgi:hypothetical protein
LPTAPRHNPAAAGMRCAGSVGRKSFAPTCRAVPNRERVGRHGRRPFLERDVDRRPSTVGRYRLRDGSLIRVGDTLVAFCAPRENQTVTVLTENPSQMVTISPAQRRVLVALCQPSPGTGTLLPPTNPELAGQLCLSVKSIKTHLRALFEAFGLGNLTPRQKRAALVERAVRLGIVAARDVIDD